MSKRRPKSRRKARREPRRRRPTEELKQALERAQRLIRGGRAEQAIELLTPLVESHSLVADVHYLLGYARVSMGDLLGGLKGYERALELSHDPGYWLPLATVYMQVGLRVHTLKALRQALRHPEYVPPESSGDTRQTLTMLEDTVAGISHDLGIPVGRVEDGLYEMEEGIRHLKQVDYASSADASQRAIRILGDWPPPHNNLSLALFYDGHPKEAIAAARKVLACDPDNVQALSNAVRFLAWTEREEEARTLGARLEEVEPRDATERIKIAEAFAILGEDERVYRVLRPLDQAQAKRGLSPEPAEQAQFFLAVAEANTGRGGAARRLREIRDQYPQADAFLAALADRKPGPNWSERYPYFTSRELLPTHAMREWVDLVVRQDGDPEKAYRDHLVLIARRYPQTTRAAEKMIWEEDLVEMGLTILILLDTPQARKVLRRFGSSQVGDDGERMQALNHLAEVGDIGPDEPVHLWVDGKWREVHIRQYEISGEYVAEYGPEVAVRLDEGLEALNQEDYQPAERIFWEAIELEPRAKQAYNNLAVLYARQGKQERAREMLRAAIEIDPLYVVPRCNLALHLVGDDTPGAVEMLRPLADLTRFSPQEMALYAYTQARILLEQDDYDGARRLLRMALKMQPEYEPARHLLERLDTLEPIRRAQDRFSSFAEELRKSMQVARSRLQAKLITSDPSLSEALPLYTKDALKGVARKVIPSGGWSGLRKAELVQEIVDALSDAERLAEVIEPLGDVERAALGEVLGRGGRMSWAEFDARFGNDLEESGIWAYHEPATTMGRLRVCGLLVESTVSGELWVAVPVELREPARAILRWHREC